MAAVGTAAGNIGLETAMGTTTDFSLQNLCLIDYHITFLAARSYAVTCRTHNINVVASPVQFVPKSIVAVLIFADIQVQTLRRK